MAQKLFIGFVRKREWVFGMEASPFNKAQKKSREKHLISLLVS